jgi:hypothetical protein
MDRFTRVRIYSGQWGAYWLGEGNGHTENPNESNVYDMKIAFPKTNHCGPEKQIRFVEANEVIIDRPLYVAIDFDDTLRFNKKWGGKRGGKRVDHIIRLTRIFKKRGWTTILWTCRGDKCEERAKKWCLRNDIPIDKYNENEEAKRLFEGKNGSGWIWSPKIFADVYIDDSAINPFFLMALETIDSIDISDDKLEEIVMSLEKHCKHKYFTFEKNHKIKV